jgi:hypothetical protein
VLLGDEETRDAEKEAFRQVALVWAATVDRFATVSLRTNEAVLQGKEG